jgi:hypothetical protein
MRALLIAIAVIMTALIVAAVATHTKPIKELFETQKNTECPQEVNRGPDGRIHIKPGNKTFGTMSDYVDYLTDLYANGATCVAPRVRPLREPVFGVFGGQGVGAIGPNGVAIEGGDRKVLETDNTEQTSATTPINKLDDYEYTRVEQSENRARNELSAAVRNELLEGRTLDWANLPFNSEARAATADAFIAGRVEDMYREPKTGVFFKNMEGRPILPPDVEAEKAREAKILSSYQPTAITKHTVDSETERVAKLVSDIYANDPAWEPVVTRTDKNKWEVTELRPKPRKEIYADAQTVDLATATANGTTQPPPSLDIMDRLRDDPYFDKFGVGDRDNNKFWNYKDFNKWTPGLERMFAPTLDNREWY